MDKKDLEERWRIDTDDRYLMQVILEEFSKRLDSGDIETGIAKEENIEISVEGVFAEVGEHDDVRYSTQSLLRGF